MLFVPFRGLLMLRKHETYPAQGSNRHGQSKQFKRSLEEMYFERATLMTFPSSPICGHTGFR